MLPRNSIYKGYLRGAVRRSVNPCAAFLVVALALSGGTACGSSNAGNATLGLRQAGQLTVYRCSIQAIRVSRRLRGHGIQRLRHGTRRCHLGQAEPQACGQRHELRRSTERGALAARQCDLVARAMTITKARQQNLTFSDPYLDGGVIVEEGPPADVLSTPQRPRTKAFLSRVL
jgi:hypothetical protein